MMFQGENQGALLAALGPWGFRYDVKPEFQASKSWSRICRSETGNCFWYCGWLRNPFAPPKKPWLKPQGLLVLAGNQTIPGLLRWCEMDFVHPQYVQLAGPFKPLFVGTFLEKSSLQGFLDGNQKISRQGTAGFFPSWFPFKPKFQVGYRFF